MKYDIVIDQQIGWGSSSASYVKQQLQDMKGKPVSVYVSSLGGSVNDALQIHQAFRDHGDVTCYLVGFVASAATLLSLGAKKIVMSRSALYLAHKCSLWVDKLGQLNEDEIKEAIARLSKNAEDLVTFDKVAASLYANRAGVAVESMLGVMSDARWLSCDEVQALGLIDEIDDIAEEGASSAQAVANIAALGLPALPAMEETEETESPTEEEAEDAEEELVVSVSPGIATMVKNFFATLFGNKEAEEAEGESIEDNNNNNNTMEQENIIDRQQATEAAATAERIEALERQNAELMAQIEALKAADGDDTTANAGEAEAEETADELTNVRAAYDRLKGII